MQSCCWSRCSRHKGRQSQHSYCWDRWLSKRPEVGQRPQLDTLPNKLCNRVNSQRHSLILWHRSNVQGGLFTQWDSGTWVVEDLAGICLDVHFETNLDSFKNYASLKNDEERRLSKICTFGLVKRTVFSFSSKDRTAGILTDSVSFREHASISTWGASHQDRKAGITIRLCLKSSASLEKLLLRAWSKAVVLNWWMIGTQKCKTIFSVEWVFSWDHLHQN